MSRSLEQRAHFIRKHLCEPKDAWPRVGVVVESKFQVRSPVRSAGTAGPVYYSGIIGITLPGGSLRYVCADEACPLMYATVPGAVQHLGLRHPSERAQQRRERFNVQLVEAGLEPIDYQAAAADALPTSVIAEAEPEPDALFVAEPSLAGSIVPIGPKRRGRPPAKQVERTMEDTLDFAGPEIARSAIGAIDALIESRNANRKLYLETVAELEIRTAERDHLMEIVLRIGTMTLGAESMQIGGTGNGK